MRSNRPKALHMICGRAMVLHVIHSSSWCALERTLAGGRPRCGARDPRRSGSRPPEWANVVFVEQPAQRGTGDAAAHGMTAFPGDDLDDDSTIVVARRHTAAAPETVGAPRRPRTSPRQRGDAAVLVLVGPRRLRPRDPRGRRAAHRRARRRRRRGAGGPRDRDEHLRVPARVLGPALRHLSPDNAQGSST